jgi:hypothetical protein
MRGIGETAMSGKQIRILEVIHLRLARVGPGELPELIDEVVRTAGEDGIRVYRHNRIESDLLIHLHRAVEEGADRPSDTGSRLVALLREHGIVEHSVWVQHERRTA